ncbi:MAG: GvpL/GvpF family gas vesicle protein [Leptolyngbyaceae bacterium]|nr:GvpL/GvpF family gas vesicle protein [Leptolyngbyaceae bacterium]
MTTTDQSLYLYGILPTPLTDGIDLTGLDKQPVHSHEVDNFIFLYSAAQQEKYFASRRNLLGHEQVLEALMEAGYRNLLPLQFGLVIDTWERVREQLIEPYGENLRHLFTKLDGYREVSVKVLWDAKAELELLMQENDGLRAERDRLEGRQLSMEEVVSIGQQIEQAMDNRKAAIVNMFHETLNSLAVEIVENDPLQETMIYNTAYLIPWDVEPMFGDRVETLDQQFNQRLRIRYNNFTAPFNFAQIDRN